MKSLRQTDDSANYAISGFVNGGIFVSGTQDSKSLLDYLHQSDFRLIRCVT